MEKEQKKNGIIIALVIIILILGVLLALVISGKIGAKEGKPSESQNEKSNYTVNAVTNAKFDLLWNDTEHEISVVDGKLVVDTNTYTIPNERIKYFYYNQYQCSHGTVLYYLTEDGNIYVTDMNNGEDKLKLEDLNNFQKLNYSNVTDIVVIPNENYGKPIDEVSGMLDNVSEYLYALVDGKTLKLDHQYRC